MPGRPQQYYYDYSGCGNTLNCNHPIVDKLIVDCLRYWVSEMHVDGFRFDEALGADPRRGRRADAYPPVIWQIELDEALADTKIIAEAWDAAGLYQVGYFPGYRWAEWNGRYRDDVRRFVEATPGWSARWRAASPAAPTSTRRAGTCPINSVNFITATTASPSNDLVSYNGKHNEANGEGNRDGNDDNLSWNCGVEGADRRPGRRGAARRGRSELRHDPDALAGRADVRGWATRCGRTQHGNNNAYCQDNAIGWFDWSLVETATPDLLRFWQAADRLPPAAPGLCTVAASSPAQVNERGLPDITWHGTRARHRRLERPAAPGRWPSRSAASTASRTST